VNSWRSVSTHDGGSASLIDALHVAHAFLGHTKSIFCHVAFHTASTSELRGSVKHVVEMKAGMRNVTSSGTVVAHSLKLRSVTISNSYMGHAELARARVRWSLVVREIVIAMSISSERGSPEALAWNLAAGAMRWRAREVRECREREWRSRNEWRLKRNDDEVITSGAASGVDRCLFFSFHAHLSPSIHRYLELDHGRTCYYNEPLLPTYSLTHS